MLFRPILSRLRQHQRIANFCILVSTESGSSPCSWKGKSFEKGDVISYLVNSCGLSADNAASASKYLHFDRPDKPNAVMNFLEKQGFSKTQIALLVGRKPRLLVSNPEKTILPTIQFFLQVTGISDAEVRTIVSKHPHLLTRSLKHQIVPVYDYLEDTFGTVKIQSLLRPGSWIFQVDLENTLIPNVDLLRKHGVPQHSIESGLYRHPRCICLKHVQFRDTVEEVKQFGFDPLKSTFVLAIRARAGKGNLTAWNRCYEVYSKWGWSKHEIHMAFRKYPNCMLMSEKKLTTVLDFLVNKLGRESRSLAFHPQDLSYNIERRIIPRCSIVHLLSLKGLVKKDWSLGSVLYPVEKVFLESYVTKYSEKLPQLYDIYQGKVTVEEG